MMYDIIYILSQYIVLRIIDILGNVIRYVFHSSLAI